MTFRKPLFLADAAGRLLLGGLVWYWLGLGEASVGELVWTAVLGLGLVVLAAFLFAMPFTDSFREAWRRTAAFCGWVLVLAAAAGAFFWLESKTKPMANWLASLMTFSSRRPVSPDLTERLLWWVCLLALASFCTVWLLPLAARLGRDGWAAWRRWSPFAAPGYLAAAGAYAALGVWLPWQLIQWVPQVDGAAAQIASFAARAGIGFVSYVAGWLWLASFCRRHTA